MTVCLLREQTLNCTPSELTFFETGLYHYIFFFLGLSTDGMPCNCNILKTAFLCQLLLTTATLFF